MPDHALTAAVLEADLDMENPVAACRSLPLLIYRWDVKFAEAQEARDALARAREEAEARVRLRCWPAKDGDVLEATVILDADVRAARAAEAAADTDVARVASAVDALRTKRDMLLAIRATPAVFPLFE